MANGERDHNEFLIPEELPADAGATFERTLPADVTERDTMAGAAEPQAPRFLLSVQTLAEDSDSAPTYQPAPDSTQAPPRIPQKPSGVAAYRLVRMIARGGMGEVWEAVQSSLARTVAVKRIRPTPGTRTAPQQAMKAFREEAVISARLEHPNIVPVHDYGEDETGAPILAMKLVEGTSWSEELRTDFATLATEDFLGKHIPILISVAQAVAFAHSRGIVHRDLKPAQVMLGGYGEVLLADWGLAVALRSEDPGRTPIPSDIAVELPGPATASAPSGTPAFMAPEQTLASARGIGLWTDVFLLGGTLYYLLTGTTPYEGDTSLEVFRKANECIVEPPSARVRGERIVPAELEALCLRCLQREPSARLSSAQEFVVGLKDYMTGAGRRRESAALAEAVAKSIEARAVDYGGFTDALSSLDQARALWSGNPELPGLRERVLAGYARLALEGGDLRLARIEAEQLPPQSPKRAALLHDVDRAETRVRVQRRTRTLAVASAIALLAALFGTSVVFTRRVAKERDLAESRRVEAERARQLATEREALARAARADSEELVQFVFGDLRQSLQELERLDLLNEASQQALAYYRRQPLDSLSSEERDKLYRTLLLIEDSFSEQNRHDLAMETAQAGLDILDKERARHDMLDPRTEAFELIFRSRYADALTQMRGPRAAEPIFRKTYDQALELLETKPTDPDVIFKALVVIQKMAYIHVRSELWSRARECNDIALRAIPPLEGVDAELASSIRNLHLRLLAQRVELEQRDGRLAEADRFLGPLVELTTRIVAQKMDEYYSIAQAADVYSTVGLVRVAQGRRADALAALEQSLRLREIGMRQRPLSVNARINAAVSHSNLARLHGQDVRFAEMLEETLAAEALLKQILSESAQNVSALRILAAVYTQQSEALANLNRIDEAVAAGAEAIAIVDRIEAQKPFTGEEMASTSAGYTGLGYVFAKASRPAEAEKLYRRAEMMLRSALQASPESADLHKRLGETLGFLGDILGQLGRPDEQVDMLRESIAELEHSLRIDASAAGVERTRNSIESSLIGALRNAGREDEALPIVRGSSDRMWEIRLQDPDSRLAMNDFLWRAIRELGVLTSLGMYEEGRQVFATTRERALQLAEERPKYDLSDAIVSLYTTGVNLLVRELRDPAEGIAAAEEARMLLAPWPFGRNTPRQAGDLADLESLRADAVFHTEGGEAALAAADVAVAVMGEEISTTATAFIFHSPDPFIARGRLRAVLGDDAGAAKDFRHALRLLEFIPKESSFYTPSSRIVSYCLRLAATSMTPQAFREAIPDFEDRLRDSILRNEAGTTGTLRFRARANVMSSLAPAMLALGEGETLLELTAELPHDVVPRDSNRPYIDALLTIRAFRAKALRELGRTAEAESETTVLRTLYQLAAPDEKLARLGFGLAWAALELGEIPAAERHAGAAIAAGPFLNMPAVREAHKRGWLTDEQRRRYRLE